MKSGIELIAEERERQQAVEGWTESHDDNHDDDALALAAASYALPSYRRMYLSGQPNSPNYWPWEDKWWKPTPDNRVRELVKAGALIAAEIDRLQRDSNQ